MITVSNADRVVFPELGRTKGDVVAYYERIAPRLLPHAIDRPLSILRYPKGLSGDGFFQKNVPKHYPASILRHEVPRSRAATKKHGRGNDERDVTVYPVISTEEHVAYLANQNAIELHVTTGRVSTDWRPDRVVIDLDPPPGATALVRRAAALVRARLDALGLTSVPVATGSKGYHVVAPIIPAIDPVTLGVALQKLAALLANEHPDVLTVVFRVAERGERVFVDWLRNMPLATVVAPYSLRARAHANVAAPLTWDELDTYAPNAFTIDDAERLLKRPDPLLDLARSPADAAPAIAAIDEAFDRAGLELTTFDRFRS